MTPADLKNEIVNGPLSAELATPFSKFDDSTVAAVLNRPDRTGFVPSRWALAQILSDTTGFGAALIWSWQHNEHVDGSALSQTEKVLLARIFFAAQFPEYAFKLPPNDISAGCDALSVPDDLKTAILSGEQKISRATELGWVVGIADVALTRSITS